MTQAAPLSAALQATGAKVVELPCLEIVPPTDIDAIRHTLAQGRLYHYIIFISRHAVDGIAHYWHPQTAGIIAVGPSTQRAITALGANAVIPHDYSSAGILAMPTMQQVKGKDILIVCSDQINPLLYNTLIDRGASVSTLTSYRVTTPQINIKQSLQHCQHQQVNLIISTSKASLNQLVQWFQPLDAHWLFRLPIVTISSSLAQAAANHGWPTDRIIQSRNATTKAIVETIRTCYPNNQ